MKSCFLPRHLYTGPGLSQRASGRRKTVGQHRDIHSFSSMSCLQIGSIGFEYVNSGDIISSVSRLPVVPVRPRERSPGQLKVDSTLGVTALSFPSFPLDGLILFQECSNRYIPQSPVHAHIHTPTAVSTKATASSSGAVRESEVSGCPQTLRH